MANLPDRKTKALAVLKMARPVVIVAGLLAYVLGFAMAYATLGEIQLTKFAAGLAVLVFAILMGHYADEYQDVETDARTRRTLFSGGSGAIVGGKVPRSIALEASLFCLAITIALTLASVAYGVLSWQAVGIVSLGLLGGWFYSMPPFKLIRRGWGEIDNALLGGFLMPLIGFVAQTAKVTSVSLAGCLPVSLAVMANLLGVHWADRAADEAAGRTTLVVRIGRGTRGLFLVLLLATYASALPILIIGVPIVVVVSLLATLPLAIWAAMDFPRNGSPLPGVLTMGAIMIAMTVGWMLS